MSFICFFWFVALDPVRVSLNHLSDEFCQGIAVGAPHGGEAGMSLACPTVPAQSRVSGHTRAAPALHIWFLHGNGWGQAGTWACTCTWLHEACGQVRPGCGITGTGTDGPGDWRGSSSGGMDWWRPVAATSPWLSWELHWPRICVDNVWNLPISTVAGIGNSLKCWALGRVGLHRLEGRLFHLSQGDSHKETA